MFQIFKNGSTSVILRVKLLDATSINGAGLTGLGIASTGLIISTIADLEASATVYTVAASHVQTIATLGTYAAPSASNCRFKEVDATNHPGLYEIQLADVRFAVSNAKALYLTISGAASNIVEYDAVIQLNSTDPYISGGKQPVTLASTDVTGNLPADIQTIKTTTSAGAAGYVGIDWANINAKTSTVGLSGTTVGTITTYTGDTPQTGDAYARIGSAGAGLTSLGDSRLANLDAAVSGVAAAVWVVLTSTVSTAGSFGLKLKNWVLGSDSKALLSSDAQTGVVLPRVTLTDTCTTNTDMRGTNNAFLAASAPSNFSSLGITGGGHITTTDTVTNGVTLDSSTDLYLALLTYIRDDGNSEDHYLVELTKNGIEIGGTITVPKITVNVGADNSILINNQALTGVTGARYRYDALTTERQTAGSACFTTIHATIDGTPRTFTALEAGRDSA